MSTVRELGTPKGFAWMRGVKSSLQMSVAYRLGELWRSYDKDRLVLEGDLC